MDAEEDCLGIDELEIWLQNGLDHNLPSVNDASIFYADFPPLPDNFPRLPSSSSSSTTSAPAKTATCFSSSPSAPSLEIPQPINGGHAGVLNHCTTDVMATFGVDHIESNDFFSSTTSMEIPQPANHGLPNGGSFNHCNIDVMDNTCAYMDQLDSKDFLELASILQNVENPLEDLAQQLTQQQEHALDQRPQQEEGDPDDELLKVFLEWFKSNKDIEFGSGKLKKGTIECVARLLGGGKDDMKQLWKLIFEWIQSSHPQNERSRESTSSSNINNQIQGTCQNPNPSSFGLDSNTSFNNTQWISPETLSVTAPATATGPNPPLTMVGYVGHPHSNGAGSNIHNEFPPCADVHRHLCPPSQLGVGSHYNQSFPEATVTAGYCNQYPCQYFLGPANSLMRLDPSETKEARKKRMVRQRRYLAHDRQQKQDHSTDPITRLGSGNGTITMVSHANPLSQQLYASVASGDATAALVVPSGAPLQQAVDPMSMQRLNHQGRQGWKPKRDVRFLMRKVLKESDVGNLRRIVLPKKEAESHLPELNESRNGVSITVEEIGTSRVWNMRYRYWPNNNSRMYLLENTGEFVSVNGLKKGDSILLYSDVKSGKYVSSGMSKESIMGFWLNLLVVGLR
ncbi:hypothetical protein L6164_000481 [Bauhinia variegata]|uniref:Uncharacterized protein n=1 Tax=Bauhinia variegata TaxID=167791 RepID=A0ACB9Q5W5_BAUVA|nr:hypothetical protein L6164_000481 [Bauhinia variegata]